jgi:hypothetical protein
VKRSNQGRGACLEGFEGDANVVKAPPPPIEHQFTPPPDGFVSLMGRLTAFVSNTTMALVEDGALPGSRQLDMGNVGQVLL